MMSSTYVSQRRWLYLPIEVKAREFRAKMLLAYIAISRGFGVFVGPNGLNIGGQLPTGIYFDKCISRRRADFLKLQVNQLGNLLVSLDEEGLLFSSTEQYLKFRVSEETINLSSRVFTWGEHQTQAIKSRYDAYEHIIETGSPRVDLWKPYFSMLYARESESIRQEHGSYLLVPSNFAFGATLSGKQRALRQAESYGFLDSLYEEKTHYQDKIRYDFLELLPILAEEFSGHTIVVRPHPNDDMDFWTGTRRRLPQNIRVIYRGDITPWCHGADAIIHHNCTTALEAFFSERPVFAYTKTEHPEIDLKLPNALSSCHSERDDLIAAIKHAQSNEYFFSTSGISLLDRYIANANSNPAETAEQIIQSLLRLDRPEVGFEIPAHDSRLRLRFMGAKVMERLNDVLGRNEFPRQYRLQKNPGLWSHEIIDTLDDLEAILKLNQSINCHQISQNTFCLFSES